MQLFAMKLKKAHNFDSPRPCFGFWGWRVLHAYHDEIHTSWRDDVGDSGVLQQWPERLLLQLSGMEG